MPDHMSVSVSKGGGLAIETHEELIAKIAQLNKERNTLQNIIANAALEFRQPLNAHQINQGFHWLNRALPKEKHIPEIMWGCISLEALQQYVRDLAFAVGDAETAMFLRRRHEQTMQSPSYGNGLRRQPSGGMR